MPTPEELRYSATGLTVHRIVTQVTYLRKFPPDVFEVLLEGALRTLSDQWPEGMSWQQMPSDPWVLRVTKRACFEWITHRSA